MEDTEVKILVSLARKGGRFTAELVAIHIQTDLPRTEYFLTRLAEAGFISAERSPAAAATYQLADRGKAYLAHKNLA